MDPNTQNPPANPLPPETPPVPPVAQPPVTPAPPEPPAPTVPPTQPTVISPETPALSPTPIAPPVAPAPMQANTPLPPPVAPIVAPSTEPAIVSGSFDETSPNSPVVSTIDQTSINSVPQSASPNSKSKVIKLVLVILLAIVVIAGGSAAAYFGYVVPNKPENVLATSIVNSLEQPQTTFDGNVKATQVDASASVSNLTMAIKGSSDATKKASDVNLKVSINGYSFNVEGRLINKNIYIKPGDLSVAVSVLSSLNPAYAKPAALIAKELSNQWIVIDKSLLDASGAGCLIDDSPSITKADETIIQNGYTKNTFLSVKSTSSDTVAGVSAKKYDTIIDNNKAAKFINSISNISALKSVGSCGTSKSTSVSNIKGDGKSEEVTIWVDSKNKRVVKVSYTPSAQVIAESHTKGLATINFGYKAVNIDTPANALPAEQIIQQVEGQLNQAGLGGNILGTIGNKTHFNIAASKLQENL